MLRGAASEDEESEVLMSAISGAYLGFYGSISTSHGKSISWSIEQTVMVEVTAPLLCNSHVTL